MGTSYKEAKKIRKCETNASKRGKKIMTRFWGEMRPLLDFYNELRCRLGVEFGHYKEA